MNYQFAYTYRELEFQRRVIIEQRCDEIARDVVEGAVKDSKEWADKLMGGNRL